MNLVEKFKFIVIFKTFLFSLIVIWGGYNQYLNDTYIDNEMINNSFLEIGGIIFGFFSIFYFISSYLIYKQKKIGKMMFSLSVFIFVFLGFFSELLSPNQFFMDFFYLFIFYIVSPIFFIIQGIVLSMIYVKSSSKILFD